mmetsp:Transcript_12849/g.32989  ORF Transcript_12849/g.32989 Transcript_12849/m.32989 type:complete len:200 (+) Transcript_12849:569-1168(+)
MVSHAYAPSSAPSRMVTESLLHLKGYSFWRKESTARRMSCAWSPGRRRSPAVARTSTAVADCSPAGTVASALSISGFSDRAAARGFSALALSPGLSCSKVSVSSSKWPSPVVKRKMCTRLPVLPASITTAYFSPESPPEGPRRGKPTMTVKISSAGTHSRRATPRCLHSLSIVVSRWPSRVIRPPARRGDSFSLTVRGR